MFNLFYDICIIHDKPSCCWCIQLQAMDWMAENCDNVCHNDKTILKNLSGMHICWKGASLQAYLVDCHKIVLRTSWFYYLRIVDDIRIKMAINIDIIYAPMFDSIRTIIAILLAKNMRRQNFSHSARNALWLLNVFIFCQIILIEVFVRKKTRQRLLT